MDTKHKLVKLKGVIINETAYKEYDKLLRILSKDQGKISVYAFGVRRPNSKNIGKVRLFTFANFELKEVKDNYELSGMEVINSFENISNDYDSNCYASYFLELVDYFEQENLENNEIYDLLYYTFKAIEDKKIELKLIRRVFELKMLRYEGLYKDKEDLVAKNETLAYTWDFVLKTEPKKLYTFKLKENIYDLFEKEMRLEMREKVNKKFKSLELI